jgi:hypothetical protein
MDPFAAVLLSEPEQARPDPRLVAGTARKAPSFYLRWARPNRAAENTSQNTTAWHGSSERSGAERDFPDSGPSRQRQRRDENAPEEAPLRLLRNRRSPSARSYSRRRRAVAVPARYPPFHRGTPPHHLQTARSLSYRTSCASMREGGYAPVPRADAERGRVGRVFQALEKFQKSPHPLVAPKTADRLTRTAEKIRRTHGAGWSRLGRPVARPSSPDRAIPADRARVRAKGTNRPPPPLNREERQRPAMSTTTEVMLSFPPAAFASSISRLPLSTGERRCPRSSPRASSGTMSVSPSQQSRKRSPGIASMSRMSGDESCRPRHRVSTWPNGDCARTETPPPPACARASAKEWSRVRRSRPPPRQR